MASDMVEIRWHARGGQGSKTAATLLAYVALAEGKHGQGFPDYGPEREGAPMRAYTRISSQPIRIHSAVYTPDLVVVLDPTLLDSVKVTDGLKDDGALIVNTPASPAEIRKKTGLTTGKVYCDATSISIDALGRNIPNTPMLGALAKVSDVVSVEGAKKAVKSQLGGKLSEAVLEGNYKAIERANEEVQVG